MPKIVFSRDRCLIISGYTLTAVQFALWPFSDDGGRLCSHPASVYKCIMYIIWKLYSKIIQHSRSVRLTNGRIVFFFPSHFAIITKMYTGKKIDGVCGEIKSYRTSVMVPRERHYIPRYSCFIFGICILVYRYVHVSRKVVEEKKIYCILPFSTGKYIISFLVRSRSEIIVLSRPCTNLISPTI